MSMEQLMNDIIAVSPAVAEKVNAEVANPDIA